MSAPIGRDLSGYYRLHAPIYDLTRPLFLFGRRRLLRRLAEVWSAAHPGRSPRILEVGCGTGSNLAWMAKRFPGAELVGLDLAEPMLKRARARLGAAATLLNLPLGSEFAKTETALQTPFDLVIVSYMLSMTGPARGRCISAAAKLLAADGMLGVVDFWSSPSHAFVRWMGLNHVQFVPGLHTELQAVLQQRQFTTHRAYGGWWSWGLWIGGQNSST